MGDSRGGEENEPESGLSTLEETNSEALEETGGSSFAGKLALRLIGGYQAFSQHTPAMCRFYPTCSEYTRQAIVKYGFVKGSAMGAWRICRCHPFSEGGSDPVP